MDFREHRNYVAGDELRSVDWKLFGKTDKLFVRQYEEETNLRANLVIDHSASMGYSGAKTKSANKLDKIKKQHSDPKRPNAVEGDNSDYQIQSKLDYAVLLAATVANLLLRQHDLVGLTTHSEVISIEMPPKSTDNHTMHLMRALANLKPRTQGELGQLLPRIGQKFKPRSLVVLISDFFCDLTDFEKAVRQLRANKLELMLLQIWHPDELEFPFSNSTEFRSLEVPSSTTKVDAARMRERYFANWERYQSRLRSIAATNQTRLLECRTDDFIEDVLLRLIGGRAKTVSTGIPKQS